MSSWWDDLNAYTALASNIDRGSYHSVRSEADGSRVSRSPA